jgi:CDGSH-type Zn-finger protein
MKPDERKDFTEITVISHGPIKISGNFIVTGSDQQIIETEGDIFLCRCGGSEKKPFCDGTHRRIGVRD